MYNIAMGGFFHESNTFNPIVCGSEDFVIFHQEEIFANRNAYLVAKGIIEYFETKPQYKLQPLVFAKAVPNGEIDEEFYLRQKEAFFAYLSAAPRPDAFVLALHGSMRVKNIGSAESDLLKSIKEHYPDTPIFCALDMHAKVTKTMQECADVFTGFKTAPHLDAYETGWQAAEMADFSLSNNVRLTTGYSRINCLIAGEKSETECEPMKSLIAELHELEKDGTVCAASYLLGFPWADAEENGVTALVVTKNDQQKADRLAAYLAGKFHEKRHIFNFSVPADSVDKALMMALTESVKPVFLSDSGDNPTAGSTADNTTIISLLTGDLKSMAHNKKILVAGIFDTVAVQACKFALLQTITISVGGRYDTKYCQPVQLTGRPVKLVSNFGLFKADLILFKTAEFELIITSKHIGFTSVDMFKALELDYLNYDLIIPKLGYLTEDFKEIAAKAYLALTRGCTDEVLSRLKYSREYDLV